MDSSKIPEFENPAVYIAIGIPGSGKSTMLKEFAKERELVYINADDLRGWLLRDATNQIIIR